MTDERLTPDPGGPTVLVLVPLADPLPGACRGAEYRLRLALKALLRRFGLRCVSCRPARPSELPPGVRPPDSRPG